MSALQKSMDHCRALSTLSHSQGMQLKKIGALPNMFGSGALGFNPFGGLQDQGANQRRYAAYRGWVYSAVHALATEAAKQPVMVGKLAGKDQPTAIKALKKSRIEQGLSEGLWLNPNQRIKMSSSIRHKAADTAIEIIDDHELIDLLDHPNPIQYRMQFVYSFVANLCLTGWAYVVAGVRKDGTLEFYSLPTTWVVPDHSKGAFAEFRIVNPRNPTADANQVPLTREQVAFAYLPNPSDPMSALAPATAQSAAIKIDENIQNSQMMFFENGVFPSAIVTMGKNPHPDVPGGIRPRLTGPQRRQVYSAIKKVMGGVSNYGNPAIIDGMIESIERLSATQTEIGWEKSEETIRTRILSSFGVHPFILGETMAGSYAQAYIVQDRFCARVNVFLDMLSTLMTGFAPDLMSSNKAKAKPKSKEKLLVWWEEATAKDPAREQMAWDAARTRDDVTQNEYRSEVLGIPPDEDRNESVINKQVVAAVAALAVQCKSGQILPEQATAILKGMGLPDDLAAEIAGPGPSKEDLAAKQQMMQGLGGGGQGGFGKPGQQQDPEDDEGDDEETDDKEDVKSAISEFDEARKLIHKAKGLLV